MKIISYSLFKGHDQLAELFYVRGLYFNVLMNSLIYPDWKTVVHYDNRYATEEMKPFFSFLEEKYGVHFCGVDPDTHCKMMLWRMKPVFWDDVEYVICRDADALTSLREAEAVNAFVKSDLTIHGILDNRAHTVPIMGGMCGFKADEIRKQYGSWEKMISFSLKPIDKHGSDQVFLNSVLYVHFAGKLMISSSHSGDMEVFKAASQTILKTDTKNPLWGSDLCTSFIGAAGCNEFETLRFFRDHLPDWGSDQELWKQYPKIFYWHD